MNTISVKVTRVTAQLNRVRHIHKVQLPLVGGSALHDVVDQLQLLQVLVRLAVQLEVGLQVGLVAAQLADIGAADEQRNFGFTLFCPVYGEMLR